MVSAIKNIIFIDIETATGYADYEHMTPGMKNEWQRKSLYLKGHDEEDNRTAKLYEDKGAIYAEFGKVVCIGLGAFIQEEGQWKLALKSLTNDDEAVLLQQFLEALGTFQQGRKQLIFCGHNIKEFDLPYLCRRLAIHRLPLPEPLQLSGKKPWDIRHIDTLELWRFGDYKHYITLSLLAQCLGIPSPKDDIDGSMVSHIFWVEKNLVRIAQYCLKDVATTARIYLSLRGEPLDAFEEKYL